VSVARIQEISNRFAAVTGRAVHFQPGWQSRGNGQTSAYEGAVVHHTATASANANLGVLINGRSDLSGPLTNFCTWDNGDIGVIAAHPANHAGASGGYNTAPLPRTSLFNKAVIGNEIIYPGASPMSAAQYRSAVILARLTVDVVGYGDVQRIKAHAETSITGKWDPGYAPSKTINMQQFRADAAAIGQVFTPAPSTVDEENKMYAHASNDDYISVPCDGKTLLFVSAGFGRSVTLLNIAAVKDSDGSGQGAYTTVQKGFKTIGPDQPGPIGIGPACRVVQVRYSADHDFAIWCA